jgi:hypothetical protein
MSSVLAMRASPPSRITPEAEPFHAQGVTPQISLSTRCTLATPAGEVDIDLTYLPDRAVISQKSFQTWLGNISTQKWETWEHLADAMLDGFYDALMPKKIMLSILIHTETGVGHSIALQKEQP